MVLDVEGFGLSWSGHAAGVAHHRRLGGWCPNVGTPSVASAVLTAAWLQPVLTKPWTHLRVPLAWVPESCARHRSCCCRLVGAGAAERAGLDPCGDFPVVVVSAASQVIRRLRDRHRVNRSREIADADLSWAPLSRRVCVSPVNWGESWCGKVAKRFHFVCPVSGCPEPFAMRRPQRSVSVLSASAVCHH